MNWNALNALLALGQPPPPGTQPNPKGQTVQMVGMLALMGVMFYFVLFRPQQKQRQQLATLLKAIKPGDKIITTSGIVAIVVAVKEKTLSIRSADTKLEILKSAVTEITESAAASDS